MSPPRLLDVQSVPKRTGTKAIVRLIDCPKCGGALESVTHAMPALFRHGGFGGTRTVLARFCSPCGFDGGADVTETNPRTVA